MPPPRFVVVAVSCQVLMGAASLSWRYPTVGGCALWRGTNDAGAAAPAPLWGSSPPLCRGCDRRLLLGVESGISCSAGTSKLPRRASMRSGWKSRNLHPWVLLQVPGGAELGLWGCRFGVVVGNPDWRAASCPAVPAMG